MVISLQNKNSFVHIFVQSRKYNVVCVELLDKHSLSLINAKRMHCLSKSISV